MAPTVPNIKLNSGYEMPQVGFGLWKVDNDLAADTVYNAIKVGYRLFDGACDYGNEKECGDGIRRALAEGIVKREELFIVSKLWNTFHDGDKVEPICKKQLEDWGVDYFDLYIVHFPVALAYVDPSVRYPPGWHYDGVSEVRTSKASIQETWTAMEALVGKGLARSIGVSNFQGQLVYDLLRYAKIPPATLQVEHHPYLVQPDLVKLAQNEGIAVTAYSSFGPASFVDFDMQHALAMVPLLQEPTINSLAAKYGKPPAQILLRWSTQRGLAVIPKTLRVEQMQENIGCTSFDMDPLDVDLISALDKKTRFNQPSNYFPTEKLWIFG
ncbi:putative nad h-dependent d-xylose reductase protein [Phaeoacremonium minimum UCRPA7]|uniref:Putative nad h-dependent d-xylose reductase protein n=1 Tax=Phaeoacremonium minimum (strain UCR-PA7) TaxID=1286976 RepID=R8BMY1_PHAM7|nr:putative nad h-dependent d-xylose reductase protein [Phaeoacremonium minimum UCRPA7]EOO00692.1 putative nad h-dependent d-xylose reductase protein [Phaeoacremonium minimum UCRPA7]